MLFDKKKRKTKVSLLFKADCLKLEVSASKKATGTFEIPN